MAEIELTQDHAVISLPVDAVEAVLTVKVYHNGEIITVQQEMSLTDIRTAFKKAEDGYIDGDDRFVLTDKGLEWLRQMEADNGC